MGEKAGVQLVLLKWADSLFTVWETGLKLDQPLWIRSATWSNSVSFPMCMYHTGLLSPSQLGPSRYVLPCVLYFPLFSNFSLYTRTFDSYYRGGYKQGYEKNAF